MTRKRITRDESMMHTAFIFSDRSTCLRKQVGAVISMDSRIISVGYNGAPSELNHCRPRTCNEDKPCKNTIHAELNAILFAAKTGIATTGATIYTTTQPCIECSKAIINAGIIRVVFAEYYRDDSGTILLRASGIRVEQLEMGRTNDQEENS